MCVQTFVSVVLVDVKMFLRIRKGFGLLVML